MVHIVEPSPAVVQPLAHGVHEVVVLVVLVVLALEKVPTGHGSHGPPSGPLMPAVHLQSVTTVLPDSECEPVAQLRQFVPEALYLPGPHVGGSGHCTEHERRQHVFKNWPCLQFKQRTHQIRLQIKKLVRKNT